MVGVIFAGRYELVEKIAEGGMARVYRGRDLTLKRTVAVKVLKDSMTGDAAFIRRFEREAQSAAALSHPHIVNIYDVGEQDDTYFMVMEYVDGNNLKDYIREKGRLPVHEAIRITRQIAEALEHAHSAGMVHRDIKPHNILFSRNGKVKVTDFGIAIAGDGATVTVGDEIIGSVQYISPEQARGQIACKQSDLYSLGIVFYEMLTGKVPFSGESPVAVAMKQIQEQIVPPRRLVGSIPEPVEAIIMKAVEKDIANRYKSATEMLEDLFYADNNQYQGKTPARILKKNRYRDTYDDGYEEPRTNYNNNHRSGFNSENDQVLRPQVNEPVKKKSFFRSRAFKAMVKMFFLIVFLGALTGGGYYFYENYIRLTDVIVPDVSDMTQSEAIEVLREEGLVPGTDISYISDDHITTGNVIRTDPPAGRIVREHRTVDIFVSTGPEFIVTPDLSGRTEREAEVILDDLELFMEVVREFNEDVEKGKIFRQAPSESFRISPGEKVTVYVSEGRGPFKIANLVGYSEQGAVDYLDGNGLNSRIRYKFAVGYSGHVIEQFPEPGSEVLPGQTVDLYIGR